MKKKIEKIVVIGAGNVATHLAKQLSSFVQIVGIKSKKNQSAKELADEIKCDLIENLEEIPPCDLVLVCSNDASVAEILTQIPFHLNVATTSGSIELNQLKERPNLGVFYPLQTFSKFKKIDLSNVPFLIEANNDDFQQQLVELANRLSNSVSIVTSADRKKIHLAAVFINNFTNHLAVLAKDLMDESHLNFELLKPLLQETMEKILVGSHEDAQTGPAKRNDQLIIKEHLQLLDGFPKEIYNLLSNSIIHSTNKK